MPKFGKNSANIKSTLYPPLAVLCEAVVRYFDITLLAGRRGKDEQNRLFESGASKKKWPDSRHNVTGTIYPHNLSWAVDVSPFPIPEGWGDLKSHGKEARDLEWKERVKFYQMVAIFKFVFAHLQDIGTIEKDYRLRFGADWDGDNDYRDQTFNDLPHIELLRVD